MGRRLNAIEDALAREGAAQRAVDAAGIVAEELRGAGCTVRSVSGGCVVVDEACDASPDVAERREARLLSIAARGPAFAAVTVITISDLSRIEDGGNEFGWVDTGEEVIFGIREVARGTVADLAHASTTPALGRTTTRSTEDEQ